jgi:hypothetical protein
MSWVRPGTRFGVEVEIQVATEEDEGQKEGLPTVAKGTGAGRRIKHTSQCTPPAQGWAEKQYLNGDGEERWYRYLSPVAGPSLGAEGRGNTSASF